MIKFDNVSLKLLDRLILNELTFEVSDGEFVCLTGKSGAGKTTIGKMLIREYVPSSGEVAVGGFLMSKMARKDIFSLRRQVGICFQDNRLLAEKTIVENVMLPTQIIGESDRVAKMRATELLDKVSLTHTLNLFPKQLSGGEIQRAVIARAIALDPPLLFADEPTGDLDAENGAKVVQLLLDINAKGTTILMTTHDKHLVKHLNKRELVIEQGKLV